MARKVAVRNGADAAKPDATRSTRRAKGPPGFCTRSYIKAGSIALQLD